MDILLVLNTMRHGNQQRVRYIWERFLLCSLFETRLLIQIFLFFSIAFTIITIILSITVIIIRCISLCTINPVKHNTSQGWGETPLYLAVALSQGLTLLLLNSNACHVDILDTLRSNGGIGDSITFEATV